MGTEMNIIVFSKNRACQLDLFLRSMKIFYEGYENITILYNYSKDFFREGYDLLKSKYPDFIYLKEICFKNDMLKLINPGDPYLTFFCDDDIMVRNFEVDSKQFDIFKDNQDILCLSLRLGKNIKRSFERGEMEQPPFSNNNIWHWQKCKNDWAYPMSVAEGHIFRTIEILPLLQKLDYTCPNSLESVLAKYPLQNPYMICYDKSKCWDNAINQVQDKYDHNKHGNITTDYLNKLYLSGRQLKLEPFLKTHDSLWDIQDIEFEEIHE